MAVRQARRFDIPFDALFPQVQVTGLWPVHFGGHGKPSGGGGSSDTSAQGEQKVA